MNVFELRNRLIRDYASYISSFIEIRDQKIKQTVDQSLQEGLLWPESLIQLNPSFEPGGRVDELVAQGLLHSECSRIFRVGKGPEGGGRPLQLHKHQAEAIVLARQGLNYVLTTGTGSGKSLAYIVPIVDHVLRGGGGRGIQAVIVYPMNALANSQFRELQKFLCHGYPDGKGPVTFQRYTGQESDEEKNRIVANPPDILLTNYVMLELILTRPKEKNLVRAAQGLRFLVLDELHTYRGRQGSDIALLVRRVRDAVGSPSLQYVGTSATLASPGTYLEQRSDVARVASLLFGGKVEPEHVIGETLRRATPERNLTDPAFIGDLTDRVSDTKARPPVDYKSFVEDPLSAWIESTFGITTETGGKRLIRSRPRSIGGESGAAKDLSQLTGLPQDRCRVALQEGLLAGYLWRNPETEFPAFAFRLHQFISRGDTMYASIEPEETRHVTPFGQRFVPGGEQKNILLPLVFCRECGQEYYCVRRSRDETGKRIFEPRSLSDREEDEASEPGFLYFSTVDPWPTDAQAVQDRLPEDWLEEYKGTTRVRPNRRDKLPETIRTGPDGMAGDKGIDCQFISAPFRFCLHCGVSYGFRQTSDFGKLASLGSEGRSTATTILSLSSIRSLQRDVALPERARKLLSFTDNRQDASLQAGHFNDFIEVGLLRSALYRAASNSSKGLEHDDLTQKVFDALDLPLKLYASDPDVRFQALAETQRALRDVIGYRLYLDLRRGWRITSPNLEQCGLLEIGYKSLDELCNSEDIWAKCHRALSTTSPQTRAKISKVLLDYMRRELAIKVDYLEPSFQERIQQRSSQRLFHRGL
jgi:ATP-dependent helicase YprA (DUF1998 family)